MEALGTLNGKTLLKSTKGCLLTITLLRTVGELGKLMLFHKAKVRNPLP
jgi:alpha-mannosidase